MNSKESYNNSSVNAPAPKTNSSFASKFLNNEWKANGLLSKSSIFIQQIIEELTVEAFNLFVLESKKFNRSLKRDIYNDYKLSEYFNTDTDDLTFWNQVPLLKKEKNHYLKPYADSYCKKTILLYLLKLRFIIKVCQQKNFTYEDYEIINPNSLMSKLFPKGSSLELISYCLDKNHFTSWFRPPNKCFQRISKLPTHLVQVSNDEMSKLISGYYSNNFKIPKTYSHAFSHKAFGQFLNILSMELPKKLRNQEQQFDIKNIINLKSKIKPVFNLYSGDYLPSVAASHWLAQENNSKEKVFTKIIKPDFQNIDQDHNLFYQQACEFQFLFNLLTISDNQNLDSYHFVPAFLKDCDLLAKSMSADGNIPLLFDQEEKDKLNDHVFLNIINTPKKNPHHFLIKKVRDFLSRTSKDGLIFAFTNQKLFVPSQKERTIDFFKDVNLIALFNFEELKGKGEVPSYLYIFKKNNHNKFTRQGHQNVCHNFRFKGKLLSFNQFKLVNDEVKSVFKKLINQDVPFYSKEISSSLSLDVFSDVVKNGLLIEGSNKEGSSFTHPRFFSDLIQSCKYFNDFYTVNKINQDQLTSNLDSLYPYVLCVNHEETENVSVDIFTSNLLPAKYEKLGKANFSYFGIRPTYINENFNIFKLYLKSAIGKQIIRKCLIGSPSNLKSKLENMLVPKSLFNVIDINKVQPFVKTFEQSHSIQKERMQENLLAIIEGVSNFSSLEQIHCLSKINTNVEQYFNSISQGQHDQMYTNPDFIKKLKKLPCFEIYPSNNELSIEFLVQEKSDLHSPLDSCKKHTEVVDQKSFYSISFKSYKDDLGECFDVLKIYSEENLINFIDYLLKNARGLPIIQIIQMLKLPSSSDLAKIESEYRREIETFTTIKDHLSHKIDQLFTKIVTNK